ncbi:hypothetical protein PDIG_88360 [Penicillium digitatum PHI26]|uniref:Uncharacterized protein n=2 Tax=Penicillium digitatum TaxID=36651 RepID=K9F6B9_PEND2|nr:hypothetical protein PDIP_31640 [Penicillium digitatum Pd1]EKV04609.1 hypothetical protein PDIG_88360 [Penicillium digitatum PHI26]EKV17472.1 hypothetical protein PDIP_31640 [Penicillium digitatum Pd1]
MTTNEHYSRIQLDTDGDEEILGKAKELDGQLQVSLFEVDQTWTSYTLKMIPGHLTNRLIVFRPHLSRDLLGCIRVYQAGTTAKLWDVYDSRDTFIGKVPKDCAIEAMVVDVKFIKQRESQS